MPVVPMKALLNPSGNLPKSLAAFNVITLEHAEAIIWGAEECRAPVIIQLSENSIRYHKGGQAVAAGIVAIAKASACDVVLHLDHLTRENIAKSVLDWGFSSLMWDASHLPYAENVSSTRAIAEWARARDVWVESELGEVGGKKGAHAPDVRTDAIEARDFVTATGVDALAVAVGSSHAMEEKNAELDIDLIGHLATNVSVPLVLHGSSGVPDDTLRAACEAGIRKVNIGTALNIAMTQGIRSVLEGTESVVDPRVYMGVGRDAALKAVTNLIRLISD